MKALIFLILLCLGIASAAPTVDQSLDAEATKLISVPKTILGMLKDILTGVLKSTIGSVVKKIIGGKPQRLEAVVNDPADEIAAEFQAGDVLIPEPKAQKVERAAVETPLSMSLGEDGYGTPAMRK